MDLRLRIDRDNLEHQAQKQPDNNVLGLRNSGPLKSGRHIDRVTDQRMLIIRQAQFNDMQTAVWQDFKNRLEADLARLRANAEIESIRREIDLGIQHARQLNLHTEAEMARFISIVWIRLGGFSAFRPPVGIRALLLAYDRPAAERLDEFDKWCGIHARIVAGPGQS